MMLVFFIFFFLILRFTVTLFNFISNPKLTLSPRSFDDKVSILIPVRNEEDSILILLESIAEQDYQNYEVVVFDDSSDDRTLELCRNFAEKNKNVKVFEGGEIPSGWLGKNYACNELSKLASGAYLMFIDADTIISNGLINNAVYRMKIGHLALLSLFTNQITRSIGEKLIVPLMHFLLLNLLPLRLVKLSGNAAFAAASGQFMFFDAAVYHKEKWHERAKNKVVEDIEIMKAVKGLRYKAETLLANGYIHCRMYRNLSEGIQGFSKNLLAGFGNSVSGLLLYLSVVILGPLAIFVYLDLQLKLFAVTLIILSRIMISLLSGQEVLQNILLHPAQMAIFVYTAIISITKRITGKVKWKGRTIDT